MTLHSALRPDVATALDVVMQSVPLAAGDFVVSDTHEYGAMRLTLA